MADKADRETVVVKRGFGFFRERGKIREKEDGRDGIWREEKLEDILR